MGDLTDRTGGTDLPTGDEPAAVARVHAAQTSLQAVDVQPVAAHIDTYERAHAVLTDSLAELDEA